jgi:hypothetical protein
VLLPSLFDIDDCLFKDQPKIFLLSITLSKLKPDWLINILLSVTTVNSLLSSILSNNIQISVQVLLTSRLNFIFLFFNNSITLWSGCIIIS